MVAIESIINKVFFYLLCFDLFMNLTNRESPKQQQMETQTNQTNQTNTEEPTYDRQFEQPIEQTEPDFMDIEDDDAKYKSNKIPYFITIQYCNKSGLHQTFLNLQRQIYLTYPRTKLDITGQEYPTPQDRKTLASFVTYAQYGIAGFLFLHKQVFSYISMPIPDIVNKIAEKRMFVLMFLFLVSGQLQSYLLSTGGLRVIVDDQIVYDVLGSTPLIDVVLDQIKPYIKE